MVVVKSRWWPAWFFQSIRRTFSQNFRGAQRGISFTSVGVTCGCASETCHVLASQQRVTGETHGLRHLLLREARFWACSLQQSCHRLCPLIRCRIVSRRLFRLRTILDIGQVSKADPLIRSRLAAFVFLAGHARSSSATSFLVGGN